MKVRCKRTGEIAEVQLIQLPLLVQVGGWGCWESGSDEIEQVRMTESEKRELTACGFEVAA